MAQQHIIGYSLSESWR